jgi:hypothetical protein
MEDFVMDILFKRADGTFVATVGGNPYHVIPGDPLFEAAQAAGEDAPFEPLPEVPTIAQTRATTAIDRATFCTRLADQGVLTDAEAVSAAKGNWPEAMLFFLGFLASAQQRDAQITWASCVTVERNHWLVLAMISMGVITEAVADAVFGIAE